MSVVLLSMGAPDGTTKFVDQIVRYAPDDVRFLFFSWQNALFGRYDVFHVHWPEALVRARGTASTAAKRALFVLLLARLRLRRTPVVRTVHNLEPHESGDRFERWLTGRLDRMVTEYVVLNETVPASAREPMTRIRHGDYREVFGEHPRSAREAKRLLHFGRIERYKGVDLLLRAFRELEDPDARLVVVGKAADALRAELVRLAGDDPRVETRFEFVSDAAVVAEVTRAAVVVLPYRQLHNSGVLLVVLSLGARAVAPRTPVTEELQREAGEGWLRLFDGEFGIAALQDALRWSSTELPADPPELTGRDWRSVARAHAELYTALARTGTA